MWVGRNLLPISSELKVSVGSVAAMQLGVLECTRSKDHVHDTINLSHVLSCLLSGAHEVHSGHVQLVWPV